MQFPLMVVVACGLLSGLASCTMDPVTGGEIPIYQDGKVLENTEDFFADVLPAATASPFATNVLD